MTIGDDHKLNAIFVDHSGLPGGGQLGLARYLSSSSNVNASAIILSGGPAFDDVPANKITRFTSSGSTWGLVFETRKLQQHLSHAKPNIIVANSPKAALAIALTRRARNTTRIYYARSDFDPATTSRLKHWLVTKVLLRQFDGFISNSNWTDSTIPTRFENLPRAIAYPISGAATRPPARATPTSDSPTDFHVVSLSRIARWKGVSVLLDAIQIVNDANIGRNIRFTIAGAAHHEDKAYEDEVRQRVATDFINVDMPGHVNDVAGLLQSAQMLVLPSTQPEPFGQVVVQGMSAGVVVVATNHGGPVEVIEHEVSGSLVEPGNSAALASEILRFASDETLTSQTSQRAVHASARFSDENTVAMLDEALANLHTATMASRRPTTGREG